METFEIQKHLEYPQVTMFQMIEAAAGQYPKAPAYEFYGTKTDYKTFLGKIEQTARAFAAMGIQMGDRVTICMPNTPQMLCSFYALNRIGAVANMIHPQSAKTEITFYLNYSDSKAILTLDLFCEKVEEALLEVDHPVTVIVARMQEELNPVMAAGYVVKKGRAFLRFPNTDHAITWKSFLRKGNQKVSLPEITFDPKRTAVILYSGGTTGTPKGICLSDLNFNALAFQSRNAIAVELGVGKKMLSCMPCFHGFGLGINLHTILCFGACCILMPMFSGTSYAQMLVKKKPNFIAGVPTIFEALLHIDLLQKADLSFLHGMFCGGDSLSVELKRKVDDFLKEHGASIQIREGYGLTECVTASCLTPPDQYREGGIGLPYADTEYCIVRPGTDDEVPRGEEGEIILNGPTVMLGYLDMPEETKNTLRSLADGKTWLYTGDLGHMDEDGYVYFHRRQKRIIITNGYNVYPNQLENVIDGCPDVSYSCVIGVKDPRRVERVRAYVVLQKGVEPDEACRERIMDRLRNHVAQYALPKEILFREELPKTLVGKVAYRVLEDEANAE